ncbi:hypothetical protein EON63_18295 [archaeon]|nr:MAG: hypothetical protein EON63_18295 [archaeon]
MPMNVFSLCVCVSSCMYGHHILPLQSTHTLTHTGMHYMMPDADEFASLCESLNLPLMIAESTPFGGIVGIVYGVCCLVYGIWFMA